MMSKCLRRIRVVLPHILLYLATVLYSVLGAIVFHYLELPFETEHLKYHTVSIVNAQEALINVGVRLRESSNLTRISIEANEMIIDALDALCRVSMDAFSEGIRAGDLAPIFSAFPANGTFIDGESTPIPSLSEMKLRSKWNFHSSLFFTTTLLTSIGYGNLVPISPFGRIFCICYAFLGIPLTLITIADLAKFFADLLLNIPSEWRTLVHTSNNKDREKLTRSLASRRATISDIYGNEQNNEDDDGVEVLTQPNVWTKNVVLLLLFGYMSLTALAFTNIQENWNFLDAFYFCLITLVTIGFGDFCPVEDGHYGFWIGFIFIGLILSTLAVDLVGSTTIERIHTIGRGFDFSSFLTMLGKNETDSARILRKLYTGAYQPADLRLIPYIDQQCFSNGNKRKSVWQNPITTNIDEKRFPIIKLDAQRTGSSNTKCVVINSNSSTPKSS